MSHRSRYSRLNQTLNVWQSFTDLMSSAIMILSLFLFMTILEKENTIHELKEEISSLKSQPPIEITEASNRKFKSGSAELSDGLINFIQNDLVKQIENYAQGKENYIVQVIGHTDGQRNKQNKQNKRNNRNNRFQVSNLDNLLEEVARGNKNISNLNPSSNADLGLMRALAVVKELEKTPRLKQLELQFRAYSAAQLYLTTGRYAEVNRSSQPTRRRIEIRFSPPAEKQ